MTREKQATYPKRIFEKIANQELNKYNESQPVETIKRAEQFQVITPSLARHYRYCLYFHAPVRRPIPSQFFTTLFLPT